MLALSPRLLLSRSLGVGVFEEEEKEAVVRSLKGWAGCGAGSGDGAVLVETPVGLLFLNMAAGKVRQKQQRGESISVSALQTLHRGIREG